MIALDLFCGAGGASAGLKAGGFRRVIGVDIADQPRYAGDRFIRADVFALGIMIGKASAIGSYDLIWASPPCQGRTAYKRRPGHVADVDTDGMIDRTRKALRAAGVPYVIENVPGAPLVSPITLCGSMFGLEVRRHRIFECSFPVVAPPCRHDLQRGDFPQATNRKNRRRTVEVGVWRIPLEVQRRAMGIDWMEREELSESIPPAYSRFLAEAFIRSADFG